MIESFGTTHIGRRRGSNEDAYLCEGSLQLFAVADGMGGHVAGEIASRLAIEALRAAYANPAPPVMSREDRMRHAVTLANQRILDEVRAHQDLLGMGTTLIAMQIEGNDVLLGHVGDSRAYLLREGSIRLLTQDHSWVNEQIALGILAPGDAYRHPHRNVITRALGGREQVEVDLFHETLQGGDFVLLCSDGLNTMLDDEEIRRVAAESGPSPRTMADGLVDAANRRGGADNVTVVVVHVLPDTHAAGGCAPMDPDRTLPRGC